MILRFYYSSLLFFAIYVHVIVFVVFNIALLLWMASSQVLPIWEGTTNILSLDVLRAIAKTNGEVLHVFETDVKKRLEKQVNASKLRTAKSKIETALKVTLEFVRGNPSSLQFAARDLSYSLARIYIGQYIACKL